MAHKKIKIKIGSPPKTYTPSPREWKKFELHERQINAEECDRLAQELYLWMQDKTRLWVKEFFHEYARMSFAYFERLFREDDPRTTNLKRIYELALEVTEIRKMRGAYVGDFHPKMVEFDLMNNHQYAHKQEVEGFGKVSELHLPARGSGWEMPEPVSLPAPTEQKQEEARP